MDDSDQKIQADDNQQVSAQTPGVSQQPVSATPPPAPRAAGKASRRTADDARLTTDGTATAGKEQEPGGMVAAESGIEETPSEPREAEPEKEVGEFVKPTPAAPKIPANAGKAGVKHTGPTTPVKKKPAKTITLPLTDEQIVQGLHAHIWQSIRWLAVWCIRNLRKAHIVVKEIHGRLVRS